jgi:hypothetical protein
VAAREDDVFRAQIAWPGAAQDDLRPVTTPAKAKANEPEPVAKAPDVPATVGAAWAEELAIDLLEHLRHLNDLVTRNATQSSIELSVLTEGVAEVAAEARALRNDLERLRRSLQQQQQRPAPEPAELSEADLDAVATAVVEKLQQAFRIASEPVKPARTPRTPRAAR